MRIFYKRHTRIPALVAVVFILALSTLAAAHSGSRATGTATPPGGSIVWTPDVDCTTCHATYVASIQDSSLPVYGHARAGVGQCTDCHAVSVLAETHRSVRPEDTLVAERRYSNDTCLVCHGSYDALARLTAGSTVFKTPAGKTINPHLSPTSTHDSDVECWRCHKLHQTVDPVDYCAKCHHARVLECGTCHAVRKFG